MYFGKNQIKQKTSHRLKTKTSLRQLALVSSLMMGVVILGWVAFLNFSNYDSYGAVTGDYQSVSSGNWNVPSTWQRYNGTTWVAALAVPSNSDGVITIQSGHIVTISTNTTADQIIINSGGQVTLNSGITLTVNNGSGTDLNVTGVFNSAGSVSINSSATIAYQSGGTYQHNFTTTAGTIPTASWNVASTCEIIGYTSNSTRPSGLSQTFGNFKWTCPLQSQDIDLAGALTSVAGDFTVSNTGSKSIIIASGGSTFNVSGDYVQSGGICTLVSNSSANSTLNVLDYIQSGGTFSVATGSSGTGTLNVSGNWSHTGGTLTVGGNSSTNAQIRFNKSGSQIFTTSGNTVTSNVDFTVNNGSTLEMGTSILTGRNFTLSSGATLGIGSIDGITSSGTSGNIQVTGSRNCNAGATYVYNGTVTQNTGNGLPSTISNLILNNVNGATLSNTTSISNLLTLTSGKITTGANELRVTNSSTSAIVSYSPVNYIIGNLRLTVNGTGTYNYPVGTSTFYELIKVTLNSVSGFSTLLGKFTNANPINIAYPLTGVFVSESPIDSMLNYGYWTLTPNSAMTSGTYSIRASATGYSNKVSSVYYYPLLVRVNSSSSWQTNGNDQAFKFTSGTLTANKTGLTMFGDLAIGFGLCPPIYGFDNYTLISGTNNTPGAVYLVSDIGMGLDAWVEITDFAGGASVSDVDNWNGSNGYEDAWQPFINAAANTTSSVGWKITFKVGGTSTDTVIPNIVFAAIDVDGDASSIKEFVTAYQPNSISYLPTSLLTITTSGNDKTATAGTLSSFPNIDTNNVAAMFKVNYKNVSNFRYRTGVINSDVAQVRQASLYFKAFFSLPVTVLPIELIYFKAAANNGKVDLTWSTSSEKNNDFFTIERSVDAQRFEKVLTQKGAGNSNVTLTYRAIDHSPLKGTSYYRLKQTDYNGEFTYSRVVAINNNEQTSSIEIKSITPVIFQESFRINFTGVENGLVDFTLTNLSGQLVAKDKFEMQQGFNSYAFNSHKNLSSGIYFATLFYDNKRITNKVVKQ